MKLSELQGQFFDAILGNDSGFVSHVVASGELDQQERISIYQNAYVSRLKETIETDHEILGLYLGDELFDQMVEGYINAYPSHYPSLRAFSENLPDFLEQAAPFCDYPLIADLARFERHLLYAFDASDALRASLLDLQALEPEEWPALCFRLHPSCQLFQAKTNSVECWQALKVNQSPPAVDDRSSLWLIWRNKEMLTEFISLSMQEQLFMESMLKGKNFEAICEALSDDMDQEQVSVFAANTLMSWLDKGVISKLVL